MKRSKSESAKPLDDNMTIRVPSMEAFAEMARASSTPFHGRVFLPEEDENTCKVELVYKKPAVPEPQDQPLPPPPPLSPIMETSRENWKSSSSR